MLLAESTIRFAICGETRTEYLQSGVKDIILLGLGDRELTTVCGIIPTNWDFLTPFCFPTIINYLTSQYHNSIYFLSIIIIKGWKKSKQVRLPLGYNTRRTFHSLVIPIAVNNKPKQTLHRCWPGPRAIPPPGMLRREAEKVWWLLFIKTQTGVSILKSLLCYLRTTPSVDDADPSHLLPYGQNTDNQHFFIREPRKERRNILVTPVKRPVLEKVETIIKN